MPEKHEKFKAYWESINKPPLEFENDDNSWLSVVGQPIWNTSIKYRIAGAPHWQLRREWVDSGYELPIEFFNCDGVWESPGCPQWHSDTKYRKAQTEDKTMPKFKKGDTVKIVKKAGDRWVDKMDSTIGLSGSVFDIARDGGWTDGDEDRLLLDHGMLHLDAESAIIHAKALLSFTKTCDYE